MMTSKEETPNADEGRRLSEGLGLAPERAAFESFVAEWTGRDMRHHEAAGTWGLGLDSFAWACWQRAKAAERERLAAVCWERRGHFASDAAARAFAELVRDGRA